MVYLLFVIGIASCHLAQGGVALYADKGVEGLGDGISIRTRLLPNFQPSEVTDTEGMSAASTSKTAR